jgi:hypothetical protein
MPKKRKSKRASRPVWPRTAGGSAKRAPKVAGPPMIIDAEPVRRAARMAHETMRSKMEVLEKQIKNFEQQELPAYQRWVFLNFGPLLTELRETNLAVENKEIILEKVEEYQVWENMSPIHAYAKVKSEMQNPDCSTERNSHDLNDEAADVDDLSSEDEEDLRNIYEAASSMFEQETGHSAPDYNSFKDAMGIGSKQSKSGDTQANNRQSRIKNLYRRIARSLHPDCSDQFTLHEQRLWYRAQEAYKDGDVVALETVLSHIEAAAAGPLFASNVSDLMENTREMRTRIGYLEEDLQQARAHLAWRFTQKNKTQLDSLRRRVEKGIKVSLQQAKSDLARAESMLQELEFSYARWAARKQKARKSKRTAAAAKQVSCQF